MILVRLIGGFGEQLFQYATGLQLASRLAQPVKVDVSAFGKIDKRRTFEIGQLFDLDVATPEETCAFADPFIYYHKGFGFSKALHQPSYANEAYYLEKSPVYEERFAAVSKPCVLEGYFQSQKYISDVRDSLLAKLKTGSALRATNPQVLEKFKQPGSICLHVRRGDYVTDPNANKRFGVLSVEYYVEALRIISSQIPDCRVFVFSDDIEWCKENLKFALPTEFISDTKYSAQDEFLMMTSCSHFVTANCTLSWWAAWLGEAANKIVVAPKRYCAQQDVPQPDLTVPSWVQVEN